VKKRSFKGFFLKTKQREEKHVKREKGETRRKKREKK
jgi:hypothetical protein